MAEPRACAGRCLRLGGRQARRTRIRGLALDGVLLRREPLRRADVVVTGEHLMALVVQALELKGTPYFIDACQAIVDAHEREPLTRLERRHEEIGSLVRLLRETNSTRLSTREAA